MHTQRVPSSMHEYILSCFGHKVLGKLHPNGRVLGSYANRITSLENSALSRPTGQGMTRAEVLLREDALSSARMTRLKTLGRGLAYLGDSQIRRWGACYSHRALLALSSICWPESQTSCPRKGRLFCHFPAGAIGQHIWFCLNASRPTCQQLTSWI